MASGGESEEEAGDENDLNVLVRMQRSIKALQSDLDEFKRMQMSYSVESVDEVDSKDDEEAAGSQSLETRSEDKSEDDVIVVKGKEDSDSDNVVKNSTEPEHGSHEVITTSGNEDVQQGASGDNKVRIDTVHRECKRSFDKVDVEINQTPQGKRKQNETTMVVDNNAHASTSSAVRGIVNAPNMSRMSFTDSGMSGTGQGGSRSWNPTQKVKAGESKVYRRKKLPSDKEIILEKVYSERYYNDYRGNVYFEIHDLESRLTISGYETHDEEIIDLFTKLGTSVTNLCLHRTRAMMYRNQVWSMRSILQFFPYLEVLELKGDHLQLDWTLPRNTSWISKWPLLKTLIFSMEWNRHTKKSFEVAQFMNTLAPSLSNIQFGEICGFFNIRGHHQITCMISNVIQMNTDNFTELWFSLRPSDTTLFDMDNPILMDMPFLTASFHKMKKFRPPPLYSTEEKGNMTIQKTLCQIINGMISLEVLNLKDVLLTSSYSITDFRIPTLRQLICNEAAFKGHQTWEFERSFPKLEELVIWSNSTAFKSQGQYDMDTQTWHPISFNLAHSSLTSLKLSFDNKSELPLSELSRLGSVNHLELHLNSSNYENLLEHFVKSVGSLKSLQDLTLSGNYAMNVSIGEVLKMLSGLLLGSKQKVNLCTLRLLHNASDRCCLNFPIQSAESYAVNIARITGLHSVVLCGIVASNIGVAETRLAQLGIRLFMNHKSSRAFSY